MSYNRLDGNLTLTLQICMSYKRFKIWAILYFNYTDTRKNEHVTSKSCFLKSKVLENIDLSRFGWWSVWAFIERPSLWRLIWWSVVALWHLRGHKFKNVYQRRATDCFVCEEQNLKINNHKMRAMLAFLCACWELSCSVLTFSCSWLMSEYMHY